MTAMTKEVTALITSASEEGKTRAAIEGHLQYAHGMSVNQAKTAVQTVLGKSVRAAATHTAVVEYVRKNYGKLDKADLLDGMVAVTGGKLSSANHMYNYIRFAIEYSRQEVEAALEAVEAEQS